METKIIYNYFKLLGLQDLLPKIQNYVDNYNNKFKNLQYLVEHLNILFNNDCPDIFQRGLSLYSYSGTSDNTCINYFRKFLIHHNKYKEAAHNISYYMSEQYETKLRNKYNKFRNPELSTCEVELYVREQRDYNINSAKSSRIIQSKKRTLWMNRLKTNSVVREYFLQI
jgi:hypothetical protein